MLKQLRGTGVALVTPFNKDGSIDFRALEKIIEHVICNGVNYLVVMGTTGESVTLNKNEKQAILEHVIDVNDGRLPIIYGLGGYNTQDIKDCLTEHDWEGVDAILSVAPYYNKPTQKGLYIHYKAIADVSPLPVIIYNIPGRTGVNIEPDTIVNLAEEFENIVGVKEASGDLIQCMQIVQKKPKNFILLSGDDALTLPIIACGGEGVISVTANALPKDFVELVQSAIKGHTQKAKEIHYKLINFFQLIFEEGNPAGIKGALNALDLCQNYVRLPLVKIGKQLQHKINDEIGQLIK